MSTTTTTTFQIGETYDTGRCADYVWTFTVLSRTAKFLTIEDKYGDTSRVGVWVSDGVEKALPMGRYSMAPVIMADRYAS
jgi:hypothetical protein